MKMKTCLLMVILLLCLVFFPHILCADTDSTHLVSQINDYVKNEKFIEEGEYVVSDGEFRKNENVFGYG